jgi:hypothetical protein
MSSSIGDASNPACFAIVARFTEMDPFGSGWPSLFVPINAPAVASPWTETESPTLWPSISLVKMLKKCRYSAPVFLLVCVSTTLKPTPDGNTLWMVPEMLIVAILLVPFRFWLDCAIIEAVGADLRLGHPLPGVIASKRG